METHVFGRSAAALLLVATATCAAPHPVGVAPPSDEPLPPGMYQLTGHVTYRDDTPEAVHESHATYGARLQVTWDGTVRLYDGKQECTDLADVPAGENGGREPLPAGHYFRCADRTWTLWAERGHLMGRVTATMTEMVRSQIRCLGWSIVNGRQTCNTYGRVIDPRTTSATGIVAARKVSEWQPDPDFLRARPPFLPAP
jgi:hypothetical protein